MTKTSSRQTNQEPDKKKEPLTHREDPLMSPGEVAAALGCHFNTVHNWISQGLLECVRLPSGLRKVRKSDVNRLLEGSAIDSRLE